MIKPVFYIVFYILTFHLKAQENLVPNGGFEEFNWCPSGFSDFSVKNWYSPTGGSPDYLNSCDLTNLSSVPVNFSGNQDANNGNGYCGFVSGFEGANVNTREYIQVELKSELVSNVEYVLECHLSLGEISKFCVSNIGFALTKYAVGGAFGSEISISPQVQSPDQFYICDTNNWVKLSLNFIAEGGEKFLTIGIFSDDSSAQTIVVNAQNSQYAYYYIDDVCIYEFQFPDIPNVFTPNGDEKNDLWILPTMGIYDIYIFNRWGQLLDSRLQTDNYIWNGIFEGETIEEGVYYYLVIRKNKRKNGFISLIR